MKTNITEPAKGPQAASEVLTQFNTGDQIAVLGATGAKSIIWRIMALRRPKTLYINDERVLADITLEKKVRYIMLSGALWRNLSVNDYLHYKHVSHLPKKEERAKYIESLAAGLNLTKKLPSKIKSLSECELFLLNAAAAIREGYDLVIIEADTLDESAAEALRTLLKYFEDKCALIVSLTCKSLAKMFKTVAVIKGGQIVKAGLEDNLCLNFRKATRSEGKKQLKLINQNIKDRLGRLAKQMHQHKIIEKIQVITPK